MANVIRNATAKFNLDTLTDEELGTILSNSDAQIAQMQRFRAQIAGEQTRRRLGAEPRQLVAAETLF